MSKLLALKNKTRKDKFYSKKKEKPPASVLYVWKLNYLSKNNLNLNEKFSYKIFISRESNSLNSKSRLID